MQIYVIRHCKAAGQAEDAPLTAAGFEQAKQLARFLENYEIEHVVCSPYVRAQQTIAPFVERSGVSLTLDPRLAERVLSNTNLDNWLDCLRRTFDDFDLSFGGGESSRAAMARAVAAVEELQATGVGRVAVVTHGNLMTLLLRHFNSQFGFDEWAQLTNPDVFLVTHDGDESSVERLWAERD